MPDGERSAGPALSPDRPCLAYLSLIDFVSDHEACEHLTVTDIEPAGDRTNLVMTVNPLHENTWTQEYRDHRGQRARQSRGGDQATHDVIGECAS